MFITQISLAHARTDIMQDCNFLPNFPRVFLGGVGRSLPGAVSPASLCHAAGWGVLLSESFRLCVCTEPQTLEEPAAELCSQTSWPGQSLSVLGMEVRGCYLLWLCYNFSIQATLLFSRVSKVLFIQFLWAAPFSSNPNTVFFLSNRITSFCVRAKSLQSCLTLCDPMDCSPPVSSVHRILQARILEWGTMPSSITSWDAHK